MYEDFHVTLNPPIAIPAAPLPPVDQTHYRRLLDAAPEYALGLPYLLHCMVEQIVRLHVEDDAAAEENAAAELTSIEAFLGQSQSLLSLAPKSSSAAAAEAAGKAAGASSLVGYGDVVDKRLVTPPPFGVPPSGSAAAQHSAERSLLDGLPLIGKNRHKMPSESMCLTEEERGAERTELHHFSRFAPQQVDAAMQLRALAQRINANDPYRGSSPPGWTLADRPWLEEHTKEMMQQLMLEAAATSAPPMSISTYHARDDVMLLALHRAVPPEREIASTWRCPLIDLVERKFGAWHSWLMKGQPDDAVPPAPIPPTTFDVNQDMTVGASLYQVDAAKVDILETSQYLYPSDHAVIQVTPSANGFSCAVHFADLGFVAMRKPLTADTCSFAMTFADGARAGVETALDEATKEAGYAISFGGMDTMQVSLSCGGLATMAKPAKVDPPNQPPPPSPAATLLLSELCASGVPDAAARPEGGEVYVRATLLDHEPSPGSDPTVLSQSVVVETPEEEGAPISFPGGLAINLPAGSPRPPKLLIELWDTDCNAGGAPLAAAELGGDALSAQSGAIEGLALAATAEEGASMAFTCKYALELVPSRTPAPAPAEVCRHVTPSGVVVVKYEDGSLKALLRDGNVMEKSASAQPPMLNSWVTTNSAGLRSGVTESGEAFFVSPVAVASSTDPVTHHVVTTRADGTLVVSRADGSRLVVFADGTTIDSSAEAVKSGERGEVRVSCEGYPPLKINLRLKEVEISGLDGTILKAEMAREGLDAGVKLNHLDGTVLKLSAEGSIDLYPAPLAWVPNRAADERSGIYRIDLIEGKLSTRDPAGSTFVATTTGHSIELVLKDDLAGELEAQAREESGAEVDESDEDNPDWSHPPRLFVCRPDGSGVELLRNGDVRGFMAQRDLEVEGGTAMLLREPLPSEPSAETYTYVWKDWMQMHIASLVAEQEQSDAHLLLGFMPKVVTPPAESTTLHFRRLVRRDVLKENHREQLEAELSEMVSYRDSEEQRAKEMHVVDPRTEEEKAAEAELQKEMLKVRADLSLLLLATRHATRRRAHTYARTHAPPLPHHTLSIDARAQSDATGRRCWPLGERGIERGGGRGPYSWHPSPRGPCALRVPPVHLIRTRFTVRAPHPVPCVRVLPPPPSSPSRVGFVRDRFGR